MIPEIILASSSAGRKNLMSILKIPFRIVTSDIDENQINPDNPLQLVEDRARAKGEDVVRKLTSQGKNLSYLVIAADSMVVLDGKSYGKAANIQEARQFLTVLSGKTHSFLTSVWIKNTDTKKTYQSVVNSFVTLRKLTVGEISWYSNSDDLTKYAGAYSLFNSPQNFITKVEGSISNIVGLPLEFLLPVLKEEKVVS